MPYRNATTTKALKMQGMVFRTWENRWMKDRMFMSHNWAMSVRAIGK
jgi:hypothetical protein